MYKFVVFVDQDHLEQVKRAAFAAGGGRIGNYDHCCFVTKGMGQFRPLDGANPYLGEEGKIEQLEECRVEMVVEKSKIEAVVMAVKRVHPYETPAYDVVKLEDF